MPVLLLTVLPSCNIFEEEGGLPNLSVNVAPTSVAGSVLTAGESSGNGEVVLTALANSNWSFSHWSGDIESEENPLTLNVTQNIEIFANFEVSGTQAGFRFTVSDGEFVSELGFGQVDGATDSFDSGIDLEAPPPPPSGVLYAWFEGNDRRLIRDFRNPFTTNAEWELRLAPGGSEIVTLLWEPGEESDESFFLFDESGNEIVELEGSGSVDVSAGTNTVFFIRM
jgi:hypothetical protein